MQWTKCLYLTNALCIAPTTSYYIINTYVKLKYNKINVISILFLICYHAGGGGSKKGGGSIGGSKHWRGAMQAVGPALLQAVAALLLAVAVGPALLQAVVAVSAAAGGGGSVAVAVGPALLQAVWRCPWLIAAVGPALLQSAAAGWWWGFCC